MRTDRRLVVAKAPVRHTLRPLCDLSATIIQNDRRGRKGVATRFCSWSATGRRLIGDRLPTDRRLVGDLVGTSLRLDATGRRPVGDRSPSSRLHQSLSSSKSAFSRRKHTRVNSTTLIQNEDK